jgi:hypothetical protein
MPPCPERSSTARTSTGCSELEPAWLTPYSMPSVAKAP